LALSYGKEIRVLPAETVPSVVAAATLTLKGLASAPSVALTLDGQPVPCAKMLEVAGRTDVPVGWGSRGRHLVSRKKDG
jgi:hypothetical protein